MHMYADWAKRVAKELRKLADVPYHAGIWRLSAATRVVLLGPRNLEYSPRLLKYASIDLPEWRSLARS